MYFSFQSTIQNTFVCYYKTVNWHLFFGQYRCVLFRYWGVGIRWIQHLNINRRSFCDGWRNEWQRKTYIRQHDYSSFVTGFQRIDVKSLLNSIYLMFLSMWFATLSSSAVESATLVNCWKKKDGKISTRFVFNPA